MSKPYPFNRPGSVGDETFLYAHEYADHIEEIAQGIKDGVISVAVDWNRSGRRADQPEDSVVYRVKLLGGE